MNIIGEKIILRAIELKDASLLMNMINDPDTEKMLGGNSFPVSLEWQEKWITSQDERKDILRCIIVEKDDITIINLYSNLFYILSYKK